VTLAWRGWLPALLFGAALLVAWQVIVSAAAVPAVLLPSPGGVLTSLRRGAPMLLDNARATGGAAVGAFVLAVLSGLGLASVMALSAAGTRLLYPNLLLFQLLPKIALGPLFVVWLGTGLPSRLAFATFVSLFPVAIGSLTGLRAADPGQLRLCQGLQASIWQVFFHIRVPTAMPYAFAGAKVAATLAFTGAVVAEFISSDAGLGHVVMNASSQSDTALVFAALAVLCAIGAALYGVVVLAERQARRRWGRG
jgi:NitT/TauT family transport system permease protein